MPTIHRLPDKLIDQIAAGEVVERPASIVKELVENSLDAGAASISIRLDDGGKARIEVEDDGAGMSAEDARLAFSRHATSKIAEFEDLLEVGTLGFRGEALASIASVARVELETAREPGDGFKVRVEAGQEILAEPSARAPGTSVEVSSVFFNVPARRKFLKAASTETRRIVEVIQGYALARPDLRFELHTASRRLLGALPAGDGLVGLEHRVGQIFGPSVSQKLHPVLFESSRCRVQGFVGSPETTRGRRYFTYVNGRLLKDKSILSSFYRAVRDVWKGDQFPALFLFLELPARAVDINVHPQKAEVRFREGEVLGDVYRSVRRALEAGQGELAAPVRALEGRAGEIAPPGAWRDGEGRLAWQGLGGRSQARASEVHETGSPDPNERIARATYLPVEAAHVRLSGREDVERPFRILGQYKGTLVLLEGPDGLYLIDQHVAHERILYERLRSELSRETPKSQPLLEPVLLDASPAEASRLEELSEELEAAGFAVSFLSGGSVAVSAVPVVLSGKQAEGLLHSLAATGRSETAIAERLLESLAASMACKQAVKMHEPLSPDEMEAMIAELFATENPYACPHGRPIVLKMSDGDLESRFGRR
ncbi:MAG: DNA mismatch repair endonuclease MutL [Thermoanaerobaculia bacterium]